MKSWLNSWKICLSSLTSCLLVAATQWRIFLNLSIMGEHSILSSFQWNSVRLWMSSAFHSFLSMCIRGHIIVATPGRLVDLFKRRDAGMDLTASVKALVCIPSLAISIFCFHQNRIIYVNSCTCHRKSWFWMKQIDSLIWGSTPGEIPMRTWLKIWNTPEATINQMDCDFSVWIPSWVICPSSDGQGCSQPPKQRNWKTWFELVSGILCGSLSRNEEQLERRSVAKHLLPSRTTTWSVSEMSNPAILSHWFKLFLTINQQCLYITELANFCQIWEFFMEFDGFSV